MKDKTSLCDIEHHAVLFGLISREIISACPETGVDIVRICVREYGKERGRRMAARCVAMGDECTPENYQAYNERAASSAQMNTVPVASESEYTVNVRKCGWVDAWNKYGLTEFGKYYCLDIDKSLTNGFCEGYEVKISSLLSWDGQCCEMRWGFPMDSAARARINGKRAALSEKLIFTYDFHTGHLFSSMVDSMVRELGREIGQQLAANALKKFIGMYSTRYVRAFERAYPIGQESGAVLAEVMKESLGEEN